MKIVELVNKVRLPINNEEADLLGKFYSESKVYKEDLNSRETIIADSLVKKDLLSRHKINEKIYFRKKC